MHRLDFINDLQPEQVDVINRVTQPGPGNELFLVQGVAGSGKTTMAMHIARKLGADNHSLPLTRQATILFLTYNPRLAEYCANTLSSIPEVAEMVTVGGQGVPRRINVFGAQDFFMQALEADEVTRCLSDEECTSYLGLAASNRGVRNLLPSQIYSLIVTFLRGRPELIGLGIDELEKKIQAQIARSSDYRIYGEDLQEIRARLLKTYEDWKAGRLDRSDVAARFRRQADHVEEMLRRMAHVEAVELRTQSQYVLGDRVLRLAELTSWMKQVFAGFRGVAPISAQAEAYEQVWSGRRLSEDLWDSMRMDLRQWIGQYGYPVDPLSASLIARLPNPVVVVDEVQDLSSVELENLASLWYLLPKSNLSRLVFFGDVNQQMTPSGFDWSTLLKLMNDKQALYQQPLVSDGKPTYLENNYRTTEQIAGAVHSMISQVSRHFSKEIADRFLKYCINPNSTLPISLEKKITAIQESGEEDALTPRLFVGSQELFQQALVRYAGELKAPQPSDTVENQLLSTVVITQHAAQLEKLLEKDENRYALENSLLEVIPVMSCKGMEFDRCVLYGISIKPNADLEPDIVSNWYTSFTRARLLLFIYLSEEEYEYLRSAGWTNIPNQVMFVRRDADVDQVVAAIRSIGNTEVDAETMYNMAEISFARYLNSRERAYNEAYLETALKRYKDAGRMDAYRDRSAVAAEHALARGDWRKAASHFALADDPVRQVEALVQLREELLKKAEASAAAQVWDAIQEVLASLDEEQVAQRALCSLVLGELQDALAEAAKGDATLQDTVAQKIVARIQAWIAEKCFQEALWAADLLRSFGHACAAARAYELLDRWEDAFAAAAQCGELDALGGRALARVEAGGKNRSLHRTIAALLDQYQLFLLAGKAYKSLREYFPALEAFVKANALEPAESLLVDVKEDNKLDAYRLLATARMKNGSAEDWPVAYHFYYLADERERLQYIENRCRAEKKWVILARCYANAGQIEKLRNLANQLDIMDDHREADLAAACWEIAGEWEPAARNWMLVYFQHIDAFENLLGPNTRNPKIDSPTLRRYYAFIEARRSNYGIPLDEWEKMDYYVYKDRDRFEKIAAITARVSISEAWRRDLDAQINLLQESFKRCDLALPEKFNRLRTPVKGGLSAEQIAAYWEILDPVLFTFWDRANDNAESAFDKDPLLGIQIMANICRRQSEAEQMVSRLSRDKSCQGRDIYLQSWQLVNWSGERISQELGQLHPVVDAELIVQAIQQNFPKDSALYRSAMERFKRRLTGVKTAASRKLLAQYFPDEEAAQKTGRPDQSSDVQLAGHPFDLDVLLDELLERSSVWKMDANDHDELIDRIRDMKALPSGSSRLSSKYKSLRGLIPDSVYGMEKDYFERLEKSVHTAVAADAAGPDDVSASIPAVEENAVTQPARDSRGSESPAGRRSRKSAIIPGKLLRIDLHEYNQEDADRNLEAALDQVLSDREYGALLVIHGYGKDKQPSVLKENVRRRLRRFRGHGRTRKLLFGEKMDRFGEDWNLAVQICPELQNGDEICGNQGITLVLLLVRSGNTR